MPRVSAASRLSSTHNTRSTGGSSGGISIPHDDPSWITNARIVPEPSDDRVEPLNAGQKLSEPADESGQKFRRNRPLDGDMHTRRRGRAGPGGGERDDERLPPPGP